jgi:hypothetical protein
MSRALAQEKRRAHDDYQTPAPFAEQIVAWLGWEGVTYLLDPCAGRGAILQAARRLVPEVNRYGVEIQARYQEDLRAVCEEWVIGDFRQEWDRDRPVDRVLTNPPYRLAADVLTWALAVASVDVVLLLRFGWLFSQGRYAMHVAHRPTDIWLLPARPSFDGVGTDATDYCWVRYPAPLPLDRAPRVHWLPPIPKGVYCDN